MATILIAEDELAQLFEQSLAIAGESYLVETAIDGAEAVRKAKALNPDLIIMDLRMPHTSGIEAIRLIRRFNKTVPILAVTAFTTQYDRDAALEAGANEYLAKPFDVRNLLSTVSRLIGGADETMGGRGSSRTTPAGQ